MSSNVEITELGSGVPLVVFVHGALGSGRSFARIASRLDAQCRILHSDRRGYEQNASADGSTVAVDRHIEDVSNILDGRRAVVVGHSFGGVTAIGTAVRTPGQVLAAVAVPQIDFVTVPGAGHHAHRTAPDAFAGLVRRSIGRSAEKELRA